MEQQQLKDLRWQFGAIAAAPNRELSAAPLALSGPRSRSPFAIAMPLEVAAVAGKYPVSHQR